ncbi:MAG: glycerol-3-phosphate 1-O-acyltransferase PlsY [Azospirillum sp.]|nr:glycerol-3-phosphate 1-O-acyltransferase PlsY [Azospirillum sp.]
MPDPISWSYAGPYLAAALAAGYLIGSVPFGLVLTRLAGLGDIRAIGSGNIGATNVLRTGNKALAALTLVLDGGKGAAAVLLAQLYGPDPALMAAIGAMLGHSFPLWLGFRGGKGVATALGILLAIAWPVGLCACLVWLATAAAFRISSLAALVALGTAPISAWALVNAQIAELAAIIAGLVFLRHHANIRRLINREEPRIRLGKPPG